jgi:UDP-N-acetylglucosamine/UDP-N-acetylgalactosamine diphosphorylase
MSANGENLLALRARLAEHKQEHLLRFFDELDQTGKDRLLEDIARVDFAWLERVWRGEEKEGEGLIEPYTDAIALDASDRAEAVSKGQSALAAGQVGTLLVAGGSGSRLGFDGPKGNFPIGEVSGRTLFEIFCQRQLALGQRFGQIPPLYLMTSPDNHQQTLDIFAENSNFGIPAERLLIFPQGEAPTVDESGKLLLGAKDQLAWFANGNGGLFAAMKDGGAFDHMREAGVVSISYVQVDNALALACDPRFVGYHLLRDAEFSSKAMPKAGPMEKVGNYAWVDGRLWIVEYFEISDALAHQRDDQGQLLFNYGNPGLFVWSRGFAERQASRLDLPYHKAHKKIPHLGDDGTMRSPESPNGYKFECFALDTLADTDRTALIVCEREAEFAPVKNASGVDSPDSARALMSTLYRGWLKGAGVEVLEGQVVEISPLFALDAEELKSKVPPALPSQGPLYLK